MNIPLTRRQLLTALKLVCDYLRYGEPKRMGGDVETSGPSKAIFFFLPFQEGRALAWFSAWPGWWRFGDGIFHCLPGFGVCVTSRLAKPHVCLSPQGCDLFSLKLFKRTCNYELLRRLGNWADAGSTPRLLN